MALGRQRDHQAEMLVSWVEMPRSPGHAFYDKLQGVLIAAGFDRFIETQCAVDYAPPWPSIAAAGTLLPYAADRLL